MARQLLFYDLVTPISKARHQEWSFKTTQQFGFASEANSVPLMSVEFIAAAHEYPIVFSLDGESRALPVAVLGVDSNKSLFVNKDGTWGATYIPAFIRRYPFVFSASENGEMLTLCIDEAFEGFDRKGGSGERLFDGAGERTPYLERMLEFANQFQGEHHRTNLLGKLLGELDILEPTEAKVTLPDGAERTLRGFHCVSRERLKSLDADKLKQLVGTDALELIYLHLYSLRNFEGLVRRSAQTSTSGQFSEIVATH